MFIHSTKCLKVYLKNPPQGFIQVRYIVLLGGTLKEHFSCQNSKLQLKFSTFAYLNEVSGDLTDSGVLIFNI